MSRANCIVCADIRDIPADAVPLVSYGGRRPGKGGSWEYEMLHGLCKAGELRHWKFTRGRTGQLFVMADEARASLDSVLDKSASATPARTIKGSGSDDAISALTAALSALATNQGSLLVAVERIALALESIATQPLARMDDIAICEPSVSANGFHS